jgi:hypothetical protein
MRTALLLLLLILVSLTGCASPASVSTVDTRPYQPYDLMQEYGIGYGLDYREIYARAWNGSRGDLRLLFILSCHTDGCYGEGHAEGLQKLLTHLGDATFASALANVYIDVRDEVGGKLLFAFGYDDGCEQEVARLFRSDFPQTAEVIANALS